MNLSKIGKRIIAVTMTAAVVVSGIVFSPNKTIKAADTEPQVRVLGATILKEEAADESSQSMRLAIQVANASYAEMCGIEVSVEGSTKGPVLVSTDNAEQRKIYSRHENLDIVVYTVVVKDIPSTYFDKKISFRGVVKKLKNDSVYTDTTEYADRTVTGVKEAIEESLDPVPIPTATPVPTATPRPVPPAAEAPTGEGWQQIDLTKDVTFSSTSYLSESNSLVMNEEDNVQAKLGATYDKSQVIKVYLTGISYNDNQGFRVWSGARNSSRTSDTVTCNSGSKGVGFVCEKTLNPTASAEADTFDTITICGPSYGQKVSDLEITSMYYKVIAVEPTPTPNSTLLDLHNFQTNGTAPVDEPVIYNEDGSMTITYAHSYWGCNIPISEDLAGCKYVTICVASKKADGTDAGNQMILKYTDDTDEVFYGNGIFTKIVPDDKTLKSIIINPQDATEDSYQTTTIKCIKLSKKVDLDLSTINITDGSEMTVNEDGTVSIVCTSNGCYTGGITINIPSDAKKVEVDIDAYRDGENVGGGQINLQYTSGESDTTYNWGKDVYWDTSFDVNSEKGTPTKIVMNNQDLGTTFVIKSIRVW